MTDLPHYILVVDDDPDICEVMTELFAAEGYSVECARDGKQALALLKGRPAPCVILLDLMMPVMNGWEFRAEQLKDERISGVPTVLFTGIADPDEARRALRADAVVAKTADFTKIREVVTAYC